MQVIRDLLFSEVIIHCPVDSKPLVLGDQFQDSPEALGCVEFTVSTPIFPGVNCEQLQGLPWGPRVAQLLLTLRRER